MPIDLKEHLRELVDGVPPVKVEEAIARALATPSTLRDARLYKSRRIARPAAVAAGVLVLAGAGTGWAVVAGSPPSQPKHLPKVTLTAAEVRAITVDSSAAAASSGTAEVTQTSTQNGVAQDGYDTAVTFSGKNIDEKITSVPEPPGSANSFTTDDRFVDGQFYIYTPGPNDHLEWLHDTNSADDAASMQFPDPRSLYGAISPEAQFEVDGTATMNGETVTHLVAADPSAIDAAALGNLAAGATLTSFQLWVGADDVVQQMSLSASASTQACRMGPLTKTQREELVTLPNGKKERVVNLPSLRSLGLEKCGPMTTITNVTVAFANLGVPQSVTAPPNPVDFSGKG